MLEGKERPGWPLRFYEAWEDKAVRNIPLGILLLIGNAGRHKGAGGHRIVRAADPLVDPTGSIA